MGLLSREPSQLWQRKMEEGARAQGHGSFLITEKTRPWVSSPLPNPTPKPSEMNTALPKPPFYLYEIQV
jgi:hypothetical protein